MGMKTIELTDMEMNFKSKDEVIYRGIEENAKWTYGVFSHYFKNPFDQDFAVVDRTCLALNKYEILPYEGNEHLVESSGKKIKTTDRADEGRAVTEEYRQKIIQTGNTLREAVSSIQRAQTFLKSARKFGTLNGEERKIISRIDLDLIEQIDKIYVVYDAQRIALK